MVDVVLSCSGLEKSYQDGSNSVKVLQGVELALEQGERIAIVGRSGSGKSYSWRGAGFQQVLESYGRAG